MSAEITVTPLATYRNERPYPFCPGCGHGPILDCLDRALVDLGIDPRRVVLVSDIGCSGLSDQYFVTSAFHGLHGRSLTYASGIKLADPALIVIVLMGDGGVGIGGAHLLAAARRAQVLARRQLEFVAGVTHELRTPLTAMRSAAQNLADGVVREPDQVKGYGALIEREGRRLSDMVEQALEYAGIQSGRGFARRPTAVAGVVEGALADLKPLLDEKGFAVECDVASGLPTVLGDAPALRRAVGNLIGNAVKYAAAGAWLAVAAREEPRGEVRVAVADRGPGIAPDDLPHVFEPFYRGRDLAAGRVPGSGLGLALVRHVAEAHGGRVTVASRPGKGTTFTLSLPAASRPETETLED